jgi:hypothetical protein
MMGAGSIVLWLFLLGQLLGMVKGVDATSNNIEVQVSPYVRLESADLSIQGNPETGHYLLGLEDNTKFPLQIKAIGPEGGMLVREVSSFEDLKKLKFESGIIPPGPSNPSTIPVLPALCPRLRPSADHGGFAQTESQPSFTLFVYNAETDPLNHTPDYQLADLDATVGSQYKAYTELDGRNVLLLRKVRLSYDYEDSNIIDYRGPNPITGKPETIHEGEGGFYANIHYAVVPYSKNILKMDRQTLLHLAQGQLRDIGKDNLRPELRTHSFIPGPFLSKSEYGYEMCEWGDTAYQAPEQSLEYEDLAMWDWDYSVKNADHVILIVFESDEEDDLVKKGLIPRNYMTDDIIGVFEIHKKDTLKPLTLKNKSGDFEITVQSGDLLHPPKPMIQRAFAALPQDILFR